MTVRERAHREAMRATIPSIVGRLQELLGQRLTAYAVGAREPKSVGRWARGDQVPQAETQARLRHLFEITQVLLTKETAETVRAWMVGSHPLLEDRAPIELLHADELPPVDRTANTETRTPGYLSVVKVAEEFVSAA